MNAPQPRSGGATEAGGREAPLIRVVHRRIKAGCNEAYESLVRGMLAEASHFPGFLGADVTPPHGDDPEYRITMKFRTEEDLRRWDDAPQRLAWLERMAPLAEGDPEFHLLSGMESWFVPPPVPAAHPPSRARITALTWLGIFPVVSFYLAFVGPLLAPLPFLLRTALLTALVVPTMTYVVMPRLTRWMKGWLHG